VLGPRESAAVARRPPNPVWLIQEVAAEGVTPVPLRDRPYSGRCTVPACRPTPNGSSATRTAGSRSLPSSTTRGRSPRSRREVPPLEVELQSPARRRRGEVAPGHSVLAAHQLRPAHDRRVPRRCRTGYGRSRVRSGEPRRPAVRPLLSHRPRLGPQYVRPAPTAAVPDVRASAHYLSGVTTTFTRTRTIVGPDVVVIDSQADYLDGTEATTVASCDIYDFADGKVSAITSYTVEL